MSKEGRKKVQADPDARFLNRELSWLNFNERVLCEATNPSNPLLERLKFLSIFDSNFDEFYMVRVSGLIEQVGSGIETLSPDGLTPREQLEAIAERAIPLRQKAARIFVDDILPQLDKAAIHLRNLRSIRAEKLHELDDFFTREVFPLCTPLVLYPAVSVPFISNRSLNIVVEIGKPGEEPRLARLKVPTVIQRAIRLTPKRYDYVFLEDLIIRNIQSFFPGLTIRGAYLFRVVRDADIEIRELEAGDLISMIEETIRLRRFGDPVLLQVQENMPKHIRELLMSLLNLDPQDMMVIDGPLGMEVFWELAKIDKPSLKYEPHLPYLSEQLSTHKSIFEQVSQKDVLLHHPYDSFKPVEEFIGSVAKDPRAFGIKISLYRVGSESRIVESLLDAAEEGKQVAAMVELKARFDESNNLVWARALERAGVHVTYGFSEMKTHAKLCLIVRREADGSRSYAHIGTGNYNPVTSRLYSDLALFTCNEEITQDIAELFNYLTGFSQQSQYRRLLVAPVNLREGILERIHREIQNKKSGKPARIIWKVNALVDPEVIEALYEASAAGVKVDLVVRGACCLRPGVKGLSENISITSIIGRFLEHSRIYYFENDRSSEILMGSADVMRRNLDRRVEVLAPVLDEQLKKHIRTQILDICLADNVKAWRLGSNGEYSKDRRKTEPEMNSQEWFMQHPTSR
ncbi:MAG: polyphosphate kinase 1 [Armatimonadetes bacterium]|nr:polyphosphate kinase 1 [Armatimonadota bacterium]